MIGRPGGTPERPALFFSGPEEFCAWLETNHETEPELWMGLYKKHVPDRGLTWEEAVVEALCFGWIDSKAQRIDEDSRRQRWTPRRPGSNWSRVNIETVERLIKEGRMRPAGLAAYEKRKPGRSGVYSYENLDAELSPDYVEQLEANPVACAFWTETTPSYRRTAANWVMGAKRAETRDKRMTALVEDCSNGRLIPPQRYGTTPKWVGRAAAAAREVSSSGGEETST
ncbi:MAG: hypothetical protein GEU79_03170 [Acidimicrobiia bacterium]|nr:hypothetical protein [Acidimicrobiia bacterium]